MYFGVKCFSLQVLLFQIAITSNLIFICSCILNPSLLAGGSMTTTRSKKPLPCALHRRRHHSTMKGYKNWSNAMTSASTMVETMSKNSVRYVHHMAIYLVCNIFLLFLNSPLEPTFWITLVNEREKCYGGQIHAFNPHKMVKKCVIHTS